MTSLFISLICLFVSGVRVWNMSEPVWFRLTVLAMPIIFFVPIIMQSEMVFEWRLKRQIKKMLKDKR